MFQKNLLTKSISHYLNPVHGTLLKPLLAPRVPGTQGALNAQHHIIDNLQKFGWQVKLHNFTAQTPQGEIPMVNIIARSPVTIKSQKKPRLSLAAHYDSKMEPQGFIGAIDSAFPCSLMLWLASIKFQPKRPFELIFFDGEEAINQWSDEDSIYGAKALASHQEQDKSLPTTLVLLDLLGHKQDHPIPSFYANTKYLHKELESINKDLVGGADLHHMAKYMQDDHLPYLTRGVKVLHLIPSKFPEFWHTLDDNADNLDWDTMQSWAKMMQQFLF